MEMLVVLVIISILVLIVYSALNGARDKGEDAKRIADLDQIALQVRLYVEANDTFPTCGSGSPVEIGVDGCITTALADYIAEVQTDPDSGYFYDTTGCGTQPALYLALDHETKANWSSICSGETEQWYGRVF